MDSTIKNPNEFVRTGYSRSVNKKFGTTTSLPSKYNDKFNVTLKPPVPKFQPTATSTTSNNFKFQNLSKMVINRMDDVLHQPVFIPDQDDELQKENSQAYSNYSNSNNKNKRAFLTDVDIINQLKNDIFSDSFEDMNIQSTKKKFNVDSEFRNLINEVDAYKQNVKDEFDELQYLIKYVKDTKNKVTKHMSGVKNLFKESNIRKKKGAKEDDYEYDSDNSYDGNKNSVYDKEKNLGKVKDNLFNIQDKVISFHQDFSNKVTRIGEKNSNYKKINLKR